jgi:hypothetical protein
MVRYENETGRPKAARPFESCLAERYSCDGCVGHVREFGFGSHGSLGLE